jgi:hypothetical protein
MAGSAYFIPPLPQAGNPPSGPVGGAPSGEYGPGLNYGTQSQGRVGFACTPAGDKAICAWSSPIDNKIRIAWRSNVASANGRYAAYQWQEPIIIDEKSFNGVDVCFDPADNYAVIIVWAGTDQNNGFSGTINYANMNFLDGHFSDKQTFAGETANGCPSVCVNNEYTFIAWTGTDGPQGSLNILKLGPSPVAGIFEWTKKTLNESSKVAPRLTWLDYTQTGQGNSSMMGLTWLGTDGRMNLLVLNPDTGNGSKYTTRFAGPYGVVCAPTLIAGVCWYLGWVDGAGFLWLSSNEGLRVPMGSAWTTAVGVVSPYGLVFPPNAVPEPGVSLAWAVDPNPDGLFLAYCSSQPPRPSVSMMSIDPAQWVL